MQSWWYHASQESQQTPGVDHFTAFRVNSRETKASAYFTLVRPNLEYFSNVWSPYTIQAKKRIEMVQRRAARYATYRYRNTSSVTDILEDLNWDTLETRRSESQVTMMFKIIGCKSKRPLVKTPPSQNVPELVKTSPNTIKRLVKTSP